MTVNGRLSVWRAATTTTQVRLADPWQEPLRCADFRSPPPSHSHVTRLCSSQPLSSIIAIKEGRDVTTGDLRFFDVPLHCRFGDDDEACRAAKALLKEIDNPTTP
jgi:hypothetical protein